MRKIIIAVAIFFLCVVADCKSATTIPMSATTIPTSATTIPNSVTAVFAVDSAQYQALGAKLQEYFSAIEKEPVQFKCAEADFLIESCGDSLLRQFTAMEVFYNYTDSKVMGDEGVAVYVFDNWFLPGKVKMKSEAEFLSAKMFVEFNRQSLIGRKAPELLLRDLDGNYFDLFGDDPATDPMSSSATVQRRTFRPSVLFFYDTDCATCKADAALLKHLFEIKAYPIDFYAINTGSDPQQWRDFVNSRLDFALPKERMHHLWDPDMSSEYYYKYGIMKTPMMFLVDKRGVIAGRRLDPVSLTELLETVCVPDSEKACEFGSKASEEFYEGLISGFSCAEIDTLRSGMTAKTLYQGDTLLFRQMTGDLMYYLSGKRGGEAKCALEHLIDTEILGRRALWAGSADSLAILPFAEILEDLLSRAPEGEKLPRIEVPAGLKRAGKVKEAVFRLDRQRNTVIIFYTGGCEYCKAELAAADSLSRTDKKKKYLLVNMDDILTYQPETARQLFDTLDLTSFPYIIQTDGKSRVYRRYISLSH